jgi:hypothetical protein
MLECRNAGMSRARITERPTTAGNRQALGDEAGQARAVVRLVERFALRVMAATIRETSIAS